MPTLQVKDATSATQTINTLPDLGRAGAAASTPMAMSTEDLAAVTAVNTSLGTVNTNLGTVNTNLGTTNTTLSSVNTNIGAQADAAATTDGGTFSLIALIKRGLAALTTGNTNTSTTATNVGATNAAAATADTGTFSINALLKRALAGITSIVASQTTIAANTTKGTAAKAAAQSVNPATDADPFPILVFQPSSSTTTLSVAATSASVALPAGSILRISNASSYPVSVAFGTSGVVATSSDMDILPGNAECFRPPAGATHIAAIVTQGNSVLKITPGNGA